MSLDGNRARGLLHVFDFRTLFVEVLGWGQAENRKAVTFQADGVDYERTEIADLGGAKAFVVARSNGTIPATDTPSQERAAAAANVQATRKALLIMTTPGKRRAEIDRSALI